MPIGVKWSPATGSPKPSKRSGNPVRPPPMRRHRANATPGCRPDYGPIRRPESTGCGCCKGWAWAHAWPTTWDSEKQSRSSRCSSDCSGPQHKKGATRGHGSRWMVLRCSSHPPPSSPTGRVRSNASPPASGWPSLILLSLALPAGARRKPRRNSSTDKIWSSPPTARQPASSG